MAGDASSHCTVKLSVQLQPVSSNSTNKTGWSCIFSPPTTHSRGPYTHTHTHIDSTSTNMKFSSVSFLAAVFSSPPSTPLFGGSSNLMVRILCSVCDDMAKMT
eukprot:scaffold3670_cov155-Alexandrium_tamarense.AAC.2